MLKVENKKSDAPFKVGQSVCPTSWPLKAVIGDLTLETSQPMVIADVWQTEKGWMVRFLTSKGGGAFYASDFTKA